MALRDLDPSPRTIAIRKQDLAITLQTVKPHPKPKVALEQYTIPADLAAEMLFLACYTYGDIEGKHVVDLGTGTGRLALGAAILGASIVVGIDIDPASLGAASENSKRLGFQIDWVMGDIRGLRGPVDTVLMNPPFGTKRPHADLRFLETALNLGKVVYSVHKSSTRDFLLAWLERKSEVNVLMTSKMEIPHQFRFHRKKKIPVEVDVIRARTGL